MIELTDWLRAELVRRADAEAPEEACGLISRGKAGIALWAAENVAADPSSEFAIGADNQEGIIREAAARGETIVGVYHSHPSGAVAPSPADVEHAARWPGLTWVIVGSQPCLNCHGAGEVSLRGPGIPRREEFVSCYSCGRAGTVPDFWVGVLA